MWYTQSSKLGSACAQMLTCAQGALDSATHQGHPRPQPAQLWPEPATHPWTRTVWECSVLQPGGPCGGSMETERPRLP